MLKKFTFAVTISALAALSLVSIAGASVGDSFDITGAGSMDNDATASNNYENFTIANGDPNEEGSVGQAKVHAVITVGSETTMLNIGAGDDNDNLAVSNMPEKLNIGASDPAEQ